VDSFWIFFHDLLLSPARQVSLDISPWVSAMNISDSWGVHRAMHYPCIRGLAA